MHDYDPMLYDIMRETANRLAGEFIYLSRQAQNPIEKQAFLEANYGVMQETNTVDISSKEAVEAKTREFAQRLKHIENVQNKVEA
ncbi:hypothetical protein ACFQY8_02220 [Alloscardovia venturai]|uniref:Uncharacterized protein n=1 Tax=Alloscardovia venturai TaxID=1769421 RepID=A0ABW2Y916_9BIFI